jgi:hypothetical protein
MNNGKSSAPQTGYVSVTDLAAEFGKDSQAISKWLLQHDISVSRRAVLCETTRQSVAVLTDAEASQARYLHQYGVLFQEISR